MLQALALLKGFDLEAMDPLGDAYVHTIAECMKLALADREAFYGDPGFTEIPLTMLLSDAYNETRRKLVGDAACTISGPAICRTRSGGCRDAGAGGQRDADGRRLRRTTFIDLPEVEGDTVHLDVIDRWGNMVSATPSGGWLQSSPVVPELGFPLNTRAQMFWLAEGLPASLAPGRRPRTTLTPTMVGRDGEPWLALGTPGGDQQDQWSLTVFLRRLHQK